MLKRWVRREVSAVVCVVWLREWLDWALSVVGGSPRSSDLPNNLSLRFLAVCLDYALSSSGVRQE